MAGGFFLQKKAVYKGQRDITIFYMENGDLLCIFYLGVRTVRIGNRGAMKSLRIIACLVLAAFVLSFGRVAR